MNKVEIFTSQSCPYCIKAKKLLRILNLKYDEYDVSDNFEGVVAELERRFGKKIMTIPQIIINDKYVGGFDDLNALYKSGELEKSYLTE